MESWIDSYFELLAKVSTATTGQSKALALKQLNFPEALYRYRSLERLAYVLEELRDGYVFLSDPANFNDPYDSALSVSHNLMFKQILEKFGPEYDFDQDAAAQYLQSLGEEEKKLEQESTESLFRGVLSLFYGAFPHNQDFFSTFRNLVRVCCFTTNPNSVVMWSHYANEHKGICIEFSGDPMLASRKFLELLHPVRYSDKLLDAFSLFSSSTPEVDVEQVPTPLLSDVNFDPWPILAACHKSEEWICEGEWRLVSLDPVGRKIPKFPLDSYGIKPNRIILGTRIEQADRAAIEDLAQKISVPAVNAQLAKDRFEIVF